MYKVLAFYQFVALKDPHEEVRRQLAFFANKEATGRIYLSEEGINGQMSALAADAEAYQEWLTSDPRFTHTAFKTHEAPENIFPRMTVKYRRQLVALDQDVDMCAGAISVSPQKWKEMLESKKYLILDVRNQYEWQIGHFEGALLPPLQHFREFPAYVEKLAAEYDPEITPLMMYCTGGIRCERLAPLLQKAGFSQLFQLEGGVIHYGNQEGSSHWRGRLFVFDDRLAISIDGKETSPIAQCIHCQTFCDTYYNCANMDCNELFICCSTCHTTYKGSCSPTCALSPRLRPLQPSQGNKPFRRKHLINQAKF